MNRSRKFKFSQYSFGLSLLLFPALLGILIYSLKSFGVACHFDEWSGRGIYPSLALINGSDMYETTKGPLVTLYGIGTAFFYLPSTIASDPTELIWIAFLCNLIGLIIPLAYVFRKINQDKNGSKFNNFLFVTYLCIAFLLLTQLEVSTLGLLKIHADLPAFSFLLFGFAFFVAYEKDKKICFLILTGLCLSLSVWSKLPSLPAVLFPLLYLLTEKRLKESLLYFSYFLLTFSLVSLVIFKAYGFKDVLYYIIEFPSYSRWSYRNDLFDGSNAVLKNHSYIEGIPLLFRFFVMYLEEYWYMLLANLSVLILSITFAGTKKVIFRSVGLIALLTLPTCLTHLARFGAVENALIFTNSFSLLGFILLMYSFCETKFQKPFRNLAIVLIAFLFSLPVLRKSKALPSSTENAPQQQAFDYLKSGKKDVYFGWYPISHVLHDGQNVSCIEVPTWVGMNQPEKIKFDLSHIPKGAKYLATSPTGYGKAMLPQYLGKLKDVESPDSLSNWKLLEITELTQSAR